MSFFPDIPLCFELPVHAANAGLFVCPGYGSHPVRTIDSWELIFVRSGYLEIFEESAFFKLEPGMGLLLEPGRQHGGSAPYLPNLSFFWLHFYYRKKRERKETPTGLPLSLPKCGLPADPDLLTELLRRFLAGQERGGFSPLRAALLLAEILAVYADQRPATDASSGAALAYRARQLIVAEAGVGLTSSLLASHLGCNPDYLERIFKRNFGMTLTEAILEQRLRHAKHLLLDGTENIDEVCRRCGFASATHFRRVFKRLVGLTPQTFRRRYAPLHVNSA